MDLFQFKSSVIKKKFGINKDFGRIFSFIDFGNVDYWFENDTKDINNKLLSENEKLTIDLDGLFEFVNIFSIKSKIYYGIDMENKSSHGFISAIRNTFGKKNTVTKPVQKIRHHLGEDELEKNTRFVNQDLDGKYIRIPKCNFDVEICVDSIRLMDKFDTFCLFSSDADFAALVRFLKNQDKKFILVKGGFAQYDIKKLADITIQAQEIKQYITRKKQKSSR